MRHKAKATWQRFEIKGTLDGAVIFRGSFDAEQLARLLPKRPKQKSQQPASAGLFADPQALQILAGLLMQIGGLIGRQVGELENARRAGVTGDVAGAVDLRSERHALRRAAVHEALRTRGVKLCPECGESLEVTS